MAKDTAQTTGEQHRPGVVAMTNDDSVTSTLAAVNVGEDIHDPSGEPLKWREGSSTASVISAGT